MSDESDDDPDRVLDAIREQNRRSWDEAIGMPIEDLLNAMTAEELAAVLAIMEQAHKRKRRQAEGN